MDTYMRLLGSFIAFKSVSTDPAYKQEVTDTVTWLRKVFAEEGAAVEVVEGYDNPILLARFDVDPDAPRALVYGHYDVQPADEVDGWTHDPFVISDAAERIYGRGVVDNKGQVLVHIATVIDALHAGTLAKNVTFFLEGNEETGSPHLADFIEHEKEKLSADFALVSDGEVIGDTPVIETGFRGGFNATLKLTTSSTDLHSGIYGGAVPSASHELTLLLAKLLDKEYTVMIPGFYDAVDEISPEESKALASVPFDREEYYRISGVKGLMTDNVYTATGLKPTVQITGIESGYTKEGYRNSIPANARAKLNFRLVRSQDSSTIIKLFQDWLGANIPPYVTWVLDVNDPYAGVKLNPDAPFTREAASVLEKVYGVKPVYKYSGGGLPIVTFLKEHLELEPVLVPLGNEDCNMHAVAENYSKSHLKKALAFSREFFTH
ncbi:MAG: Beta-Ala-Xaa dipeptidase [candidate division WS6 bacterium OLB20]|uniref:Beta-Ala-Xaa dipeptidase n=1 Tax=candidate division WS6 bacterium OLB20 TaxID=1617426 RepID=A0A136M089_9BACT|nr:MAG: Beta-Ala-Xaa dipeptidase [candidate division WS6 bacterium OLB20]